MNEDKTNDIPSALIRAAAEATADPNMTVEEALARLPGDPGAVYEEAVIHALKTIRQKDEANYARLVAKAKGCKSRLDKLTAPERSDSHDNKQDVVLGIVQKYCRLGHDLDGKGIAVVERDDCRQVWLLESQGFKDWLRSVIYQEHRTGITDQALDTVIATLKAIAQHEGELMTVHVRCAKQGDAYFLDRGADDWSAIRVDKDGWAVTSRPRAFLTRTANMRPLPEAPLQGDLKKLWNHVNVPEHYQLPLLAWLLDSLRPDTPYPILELTGEQGSAKSSTQRRLRSLIDPNKVPLRGRPKTVEDIYVSAANSYVVSFENLSHLTPEQQDALCTLSTGGGFATRQFYTNGEEHVLETKRPVIFNGINPVATQPDLIERTISIELPTISSDERRDEQTLELEWESDYPVILTGLLELFAKTLAKLPSVNLKAKQRMADYQMLGEAMAQQLGHPDGQFSRQYEQIIGEGVERGLETYGIVNALQVFMSGQRQWAGTYLVLLGELSSTPGVDRSHWPRSPRALSGQLKRLAPGLRRVGLEIEALGHGRAGSQVKIINRTPTA